MTTINDLKYNLAGGSRKNKFLIELTFGSLDSAKFNCLCTNAQFPGKQIQTVTVSRHGRKYPVRSETDYGNTYEVTVLDDNKLSLRQFFDSWLTYVDDSTKESDTFYLMRDSRNSFLNKLKNACSAVKDLADGAVATITINRPKALNALNSQVLDELDQTLDAIDLDTVRCVILTGAGDKSFVAGADIGEMSTLTKAEGEAFGKKGNDVFRKLETLPIPVIAAVNGFALGGGCEISMSCDIRICSENAMFGQPEAGLGITPGFGGTQRLARTVGVGMAKQLIYTARNIKADEAYRIGLVNAVYAPEELMPAAQKMAAKIAANAPIAVRACKKAINDGLDAAMDDAIVIEEKLFGSCFETEDQRAGMGNFLEKDPEKKLKVVPFQNK